MVRRGLRCVAAALLLAVTVRADVVFRVPEVLVRHAAASRPVGTGQSPNSSASISPKSAARAGADRDPWPAGDSVLEVHYEEYFVEHEVSTADAKKAAKALNLEDIPWTRVGCGPCSRRELEYCESRVLADHCCCERRHAREPFPWLAHTCYAGPRRCRPLAADCAAYARLRDCCCHRRLAERWKAILSSSEQVSAGGVTLLVVALVLVGARL